jgi:hypothetical protein
VSQESPFSGPKDRHAEKVAHLARALLEEIAAMREAPVRDETSRFHAEVITEYTGEALQESRLERATSEFFDSLYRRLPDVRGEHDMARYLHTIDRPYVSFHGNLDDPFYDDLIAQAADSGFEWNRFEVGIGASAIEIIVTVGASIGGNIAASALYDFLKSLRKKDLDPEIDSHAAVELCKLDLARTIGQIPLGATFAVPSPLTNAKFEVRLHSADGERIFAYQIRGDGEIWLRTSRRFVQESGRDDSKGAQK